MCVGASYTREMLMETKILDVLLIKLLYDRITNMNIILPCFPA
jgi:hypothetical protein